ncbi:MAG: hypothetical protein HQL69_05770 [Magnetococcales bacterium]|nr:hypothetical protein [Magnetococcales bacterium]
MNTEDQSAVDAPPMTIVQRKSRRNKPSLHSWNMCIAAVSLLVAFYWMVLYRITWSLEWSFLALCATIVAGLVSAFDLAFRHSHFRRDDDNLPLFEIVIVVISISSAAMLYFRTLAD